MAQEEKIPVVGLFTGAQMLYEPLKREIINVRASYYDETREQIDKLWEQNIRKIGVVYQDDPFGKAVLDGVKLALQKHNAVPVAMGTFAHASLDVEAGLREVMAAHPQVIVMVGPYASAAAIVKQAHAGTIITQVMPPYDRMNYPTVALYRKCLSKYSPGEAPTFVSFEGFVDAMVVIEGLKRAGKDVTREKFVRAIESIHEMNFGLGPRLVLNYRASDHKGFDNVYPTIVKGGQPVLLTDWSSVGK
jgi:branched-chain amino acid transport system substrate-binding protein